MKQTEYNKIWYLSWKKKESFCAFWALNVVFEFFVLVYKMLFQEMSNLDPNMFFF